MKIASTATLALCGVMLPFTSLQAAGPPGKTYGGFTAAQTFTLTVTDRDSVRTRGFRVDEGVSVPSGMPDFKDGQKVTFRIGNKGQLTGPGFTIKFQEEEGNVNVYASEVSSNSNSGRAATVTKGKSDRAKKATLVFFKFSFDGIVPTTHTVKYQLERNP